MNFRSNNKHVKAFILALLSVIALLCAQALAAMPDKDIIILYTNDVHCGVDENIGYAGLAYYKNEMLERTPYVTLVDAGDAVQGEIIGTISNGRYLIEIMNAVGYDVAVPGNHEFDYGMEQFQNFAKNLKCGYVSCNFRDLRTGELVFEPYKIINYNNTKVAFVGVCTPDCIVTSTPSSFMNDKGEFIYDFDGELTGKKLCASIQKAVDAARKDGADFVILTAHIGENKSLKVWSAPFIAENTRGIDAIIDGHSHEVTPSLTVKNLDGKDVIITQTGTKLKYIGRMTIDTAGKLKTELIDKVSGRDDNISNFINGLKDRYEETLNTHLGYASFDLKASNGTVNGHKQWLLRNAETNLCNFLTDAFLDAAAGSADIALINAGGIRSDINAGELTYNSALMVFPFGNTVCICDVPGQTILDELELGVSRLPKNFGGLLHAAGLSYTVDESVESPVQIDDKNILAGFAAGAPRRVRDVKVNGEPLDPNRTYSVISVSYALMSKGDGHLFNGARVTKPDFITAADAVAHYIKKFPVLPDKYREPQGRMKVIH